MLGKYGETLVVDWGSQTARRFNARIIDAESRSRSWTVVGSKRFQRRPNDARLDGWDSSLRTT